MVTPPLKSFKILYVEKILKSQNYEKCTYPLKSYFLLQPATLLKVTLLHGCFSRFLNCANGTKSRKTSHIEFPEKLSTLVISDIY